LQPRIKVWQEILQGNWDPTTCQRVKYPQQSVPGTSTATKEQKRMNRKELIDALATKTDSSKADADRNIAALIEIITATLKKGDNVALVGFGTFEVRKRAARNGRNPSTGAAIKIKASKQPAFKAGATLKAAVNGVKK
jgi:DNA-binding protein HU-beta